MGFNERSRQHDEDALGLVESAFRELGFLVFPYGIEQLPELQRVLRGLHNGTSKMLRYRPDRVAVKPGKGTLLLGVKSEGGRSPNFAVEFDAWDAARMWNQDARRVLYVFVDLLSRDVLACWPEALSPRKVFVPRRGDLLRVKSLLPPGAVARWYPAVRGSGTAFFLVSKSDLQSLREALGPEWKSTTTS
ncbi:hypothetical protein [Ammonifex thiophilus]|uniref:hypothetical protein n=1 Tax=Ammonifex thiophilus TaxID=444093 RepID=UPI0010699ACE|nr:hypothetical protein [Ammonifex thiophilus]